MNPVIASDRVFEISCLTVFTGNDGSSVAVASGSVVAAEDPSLIGRNGIFAVQDLGEGHYPADRMTLGVLLSPVRCSDVTSEDALRTVFPRGLFATGRQHPGASVVGTGVLLGGCSRRAGVSDDAHDPAPSIFGEKAFDRGIGSSRGATPSSSGPAKRTGGAGHPWAHADR